MVNCLLCNLEKNPKPLFYFLAPTRGPDIWRERSPSGKSLKIFWKVDRTLKVLKYYLM